MSPLLVPRGLGLFLALAKLAHGPLPLRLHRQHAAFGAHHHSELIELGVHSDDHGVLFAAFSRPFSEPVTLFDHGFKLLDLHLGQELKGEVLARLGNQLGQPPLVLYVDQLAHAVRDVADAPFYFPFLPRFHINPIQTANNEANHTSRRVRRYPARSAGRGTLDPLCRSLRGEPVPEVEDTAEDKADFAAIGDEDITFAFDTVFIVRKTSDKPLDGLRAYLGSIGDSLVIGEDDESFKVHVHTDTPGDALNEAQKYGTLELAKIENMRTQAADLAAGRKAQSTDDLDAIEEELEKGEAAVAAPEKRYGFLAVCAGEGLAAVFRDLTVDRIVSGGQTMNPSTEAILQEVNRTPSEVVFILPNNKNIIMAAQQCVGLTEKQVIVVPTATVPQGISAMMAVDPDNDDPQAILAAMTEAASHVTTAQITYAARNSDFDGFAINEGDYLALCDGKLLGTDRDLNVLLEKLAQVAVDKDAEFITVYAGEGVTEEDSDRTAQLFAAACPDAEVAALPGGQPVYYYIIAIE